EFRGLVNRLVWRAAGGLLRHQFTRFHLILLVQCLDSIPHCATADRAPYESEEGGSDCRGGTCCRWTAASRGPPREQREMEEVLPQRARGVDCHIVVKKESAELLARASDLAAPVPTPRVVPGRLVEALEGTRQRSVEPIGPLRRPG